MLKRMLELSESNFRKFLKQAPNSFINFLCECLLNVMNGNVPVNKQLLKNKEKSFQHLLSKKTSLEKKRNILAKNQNSFERWDCRAIFTCRQNNACRRVCFDPQKNVHFKKPNQ